MTLLTSPNRAYQTNACSITVAASVSDKFNAYTSTIRSWYSSNSAAINSVLSQCPKLSSYAGDLPVCTGKDSSNGASSTATKGSSGAATTTGRATDAGSGSATAATASAGDSSSNPTGSAASVTKSGSGPRETNFVAGAVAAIGFLGVVAAL